MSENTSTDQSEVTTEGSSTKESVTQDSTKEEQSNQENTNKESISDEGSQLGSTSEESTSGATIEPETESASQLSKIDASSSKTPRQAFQHLIEAYKKNGPLPRKERIQILKKLRKTLKKNADKVTYQAFKW